MLLGQVLMDFVPRSSRPSDFSYKHDAKHSSTLVVAQLWERDDSSILQDLDVLLTTVKACMFLPSTSEE